ncbi:hypothetical protein [uncultured Subdoligranulum sp.]|uniref:hypothetical protein n=1 Tax=uncultured Subdoligranulum sp. TaxID=512298 RepID=UPI00320A82BD
MLFSMTTEYDHRFLACGLWPRPEIKPRDDRPGRPPLTPEVRIPCPLLPETLVYGVCRTLTKVPRLAARLVPLSYRLRFVRGKKKRKSPRLWILLSPLYLDWDAPGAVICVQVSVSAAGVQVERIVVQSRRARLPGRRR